MRKFSAGAALCASAFTTALAVACMTACAPRYPDEAYENHPVADLIAEYLHDPSDETFSPLTDAGLKKVSESELRAALGGAAAMYATMFILRYRLENCLLMIALPLLAVVNLYCFYLGFRGIALFL